MGVLGIAEGEVSKYYTPAVDLRWEIRRRAAQQTVRKRFGWLRNRNEIPSNRISPARQSHNFNNPQEKAE
jgi:hypothetical protein